MYITKNANHQIPLTVPFQTRGECNSIMHAIHITKAFRLLGLSPKSLLAVTIECTIVCNIYIIELANHRDTIQSSQ